MTLQLAIILLLTTLAALYMVRGAIKSACGSCKSKGCPARKMEAIRAKVESRER
jgi:positive regulator of sigma E activity